MDSHDVAIARIQALCKEKGINPYRLSALSGLPVSTVKSVLNGQSRNPGIVTIKKICDGLDLSLPEFFKAKEFAELENDK